MLPGFTCLVVGKRWESADGSVSIGLTTTKACTGPLQRFIAKHAEHGLLRDSAGNVRKFSTPEAAASAALKAWT